MSAECAVDEALASGQQVVGYGDMPFFWQTLGVLSEPVPMPLAIASSPPNVPVEFTKVVLPGTPRASIDSGILPLSVVAAYRQTDGTVNTFQGGADSSSELNEMLGQWHPTAAGPDAGALGEPHSLQPFKFDPSVWMNLGSYNASASIDASGHVSGTANGAYRLYRLNTRDPRYDYFLITLDGLNKVSGFNGCVYKFPTNYCEWLNRRLKLSVYLARVSDPKTGIGNIIEAEPKSAATSGKYEISEGADLTAEVNCSVGDSAGVAKGGKNPAVTGALQPRETGCGVSGGATYSSKVTQTWDIQSRTVHNFTTPLGTTGDWEMTFTGWEDNCKGGPFPEDSKTAGDFGAATIIRIPRDVIYTSPAPRLMVVASVQGGTVGWEYLINCKGFEYRSGWAVFPIFELPVFFVSPTTIAVPAGGSRQFTINSKVPDADIGLTPSLLLVKNGKILDPASVGLDITADDRTAIAIYQKRPDIVPRVQVWKITASPTAAKTTYTLFVDTSPGGETDNVRRGPIEVSLTIN